jgi:hypothetical protein
MTPEAQRTLRAAERSSGTKAAVRSECTVLIVDADADDWFPVKVARCLAGVPGFRVLGLSCGGSTLLRASRHCAGLHVSPPAKDEERIEAIAALVARRRVDVLLPSTIKGFRFVSKHRETLRRIAAVPPVVDFEKIECVDDKWAFQAFAESRGLPTIPTIRLGVAGEPLAPSAPLESLPYPALFKPATAAAGGRGIVLGASPADVRARWTRLEGLRPGAPYLLQSFVPGLDLCLGVHCRKGEIVASTLQRSLSGTRDRFGPQRAMEFVRDEQVSAAGRDLVSALSWSGVAYIDFRTDDRTGRPLLLEVNPRFGQAILGSLTAGVNFPLLACMDALGEPAPPQEYVPTRYAHPMAHLGLMASRLRGARGLPSIPWRQSGLRFSLGDPLPEVVNAAGRAVRRARRLFRVEPQGRPSVPPPERRA